MSAVNPERETESNTRQKHWAEGARLGVSTLYEASGLTCAMDPEIHPVWLGAKVSGPAFTVRCHPGDNLAIHYGLENAPSGSVLVADVGGHLAGYWGEVMTVAAQSHNIAGLVIDGGVRDTEAIKRLNFPVFARGIAVFGTAKHDKGAIGVPLVVGGVQVRPGDLIVGDSDGVISLPEDEYERILAMGRERENKEQFFMQRLQQGETTLDLFRFR